MTEGATSKRRPSRVGRWLVLAALLLGGVGFVFRHALLPEHHPVEAAAAAPMAVSVVTAERRPIAQTVVAGGTVVARAEALVTARIEGIPVTELLVEVGDRVEAGQPLARLDTQRIDLQLAQKTAEAAQAEAAVAQAEALLVEADADADEARATSERATALRQRDNVSAQALEERETAAAMAAARAKAQRFALAAARAASVRIGGERDELDWERGQATVRATVAGIVIERDATLGQAAPADGTPLFRILGDGAIEMEASVVETALPAIRAGQAATVAVAGGAGPVEGTVRLVSPRIDAATRMGRVWIALPEGAARPGGSGRATFVADPHEAIVVPRGAVLAGEAGPRVQVVENGAVTVRVVETGIADAGGIEIVAGLDGGETVVAAASAFLREGARVAPVPLGVVATEGGR